MGGCSVLILEWQEVLSLLRIRKGYCTARQVDGKCVDSKLWTATIPQTFLLSNILPHFHANRFRCSRTGLDCWNIPAAAKQGQGCVNQVEGLWIQPRIPPDSFFPQLGTRSRPGRGALPALMRIWLDLDSEIPPVHCYLQSLSARLERKAAEYMPHGKHLTPQFSQRSMRKCVIKKKKYPH